MQGSSAYMETAPAAQTIYSVKKNGVEVGTVTFAANAREGVLAKTNPGATAFAVGDRLSVHAPASQDSTASDLSGYIVLITT
jgi:6-phosphogluconolactonase (cycloisomerase 2 family)